MSYILLREAYIANTRNDTSGTSGDPVALYPGYEASDPDKCNSFISTSHTSSYVDETFS